MNPAELLQLKAIIDYQGEILTAYQEQVVAFQATNTHLIQTLDLRSAYNLIQIRERISAFHTNRGN